MERYRNLGPRKPPPEPEPEPPSIFEPERDVTGEIAEDVMGNPVVRLNKHCYQELGDKRNPTERRGDLSPPPLTKCLFRIGKRKARGDLFDHLKKERPLPEKKETVKSELPERVEDDPPGSADP